MSENNTPSEGTSPFKNFWSRSKEMVSGKNFQFKQQDSSQGKDEDKDTTTAQTQKQHRRAQVRKAQIEHRKRKKDYTKELEQTVTRLREMISSTESETLVLRQENTSIRKTLAKSNIEHAYINPPTNDWAMHNSHEWPPSTNVNIEFDHLVQADCLQVQTTYRSPTHPQIAMNTNLPETDDLSTQISANQTGSVPKFLKVTPDQSDIAINFILALEHPCRSHFHFVPPLSTAHDSDAPATGHELMASTLLFSSAPSSTFGKTSDTSKVKTSWNAPSLELSTLYAMSLSLPKGDFEITPVQAWFLIVGEYEFGIVLEKVEKLKSSLNELVKCWDFGAVLNEALFWEVVKSILGEN